MEGLFSDHLANQLSTHLESPDGERGPLQLGVGVDPLAPLEEVPEADEAPAGADGGHARADGTSPGDHVLELEEVCPVLAGREGDEYRNKTLGDHHKPRKPEKGQRDVSDTDL